MSLGVLRNGSTSLFVRNFDLTWSCSLTPGLGSGSDSPRRMSGLSASLNNALWLACSHFRQYLPRSLRTAD